MTGRALRAFDAFPLLVAVISYDDPSGTRVAHAPYTLTVDGKVQPGG